MQESARSKENTLFPPPPWVAGRAARGPFLPAVWSPRAERLTACVTRYSTMPGLSSNVVTPRKTVHQPPGKADIDKASLTVSNPERLLSSVDDIMDRDLHHSGLLLHTEARRLRRLCLLSEYRQRPARPVQSLSTRSEMKCMIAKFNQCQFRNVYINRDVTSSTIAVMFGRYFLKLFSIKQV